MLKTPTVPLLALVVLAAGCGSDSPSPEDTVRAFTKAYAAGNIAKACALYDQKGGGGMTQALVAAAGDDERASAEIERALGSVTDKAGICPANLRLLRAWDPEPSRTATLTVSDTDTSGETARVDSSAGTWQLHEVGGKWRLSNVDPVIPTRLRPT